jgi:hypothetical protein
MTEKKPIFSETPIVADWLREFTKTEAPDISHLSDAELMAAFPERLAAMQDAAALGAGFTHVARDGGIGRLDPRQIRIDALEEAAAHVIAQSEHGTRDYQITGRQFATFIRSLKTKGEA